MTRFAILAIASLVLASCSDSAEVATCEKAIISKLSTPSSYKRVNADEFRADAEHPGQPQRFTEHRVTIEYDAVNSFNAPIRNTAHCSYRLVDGHSDLGNMIDPDAV